MITFYRAQTHAKAVKAIQFTGPTVTVTAFSSTPNKGSNAEEEPF